MSACDIIIIHITGSINGFNDFGITDTFLWFKGVPEVAANKQQTN